MEFKILVDLKPEDLKDKTVLVRADYNVPIESGRVVNDYRIKRSLPTVEFLLSAGSRVILVSHLGDSGSSLAPVASYLDRFFKIRLVTTVDELSFDNSEEVLMLENLRSFPGEEISDENFAKSLADRADLYVNDAFSVSHREHASVVLVPKYLPAVAGFLFAEEFAHLHKLFSPAKPMTLILGGAKFSTKLPLVKTYLDIADDIYITGALAHSFFKEQGFEVGQSLMDDVIPGLGELLENKKVHLPTDVVVQTETGDQLKDLSEVSVTDIIYDAGPKTVEEMEAVILKSETILWNGPLGNFEKGYDEATNRVAKLVAGSTAYSVVGGGDTVSAIETLNLNKDFGFVSTAGGAMLEFLATKTLPGLEALKSNK